MLPIAQPWNKYITHNNFEFKIRSMEYSPWRGQTVQSGPKIEFFCKTEPNSLRLKTTLYIRIHRVLLHSNLLANKLNSDKHN